MIRNKIKHGQKDFDKGYYGAYYKKYTASELNKAFRWFQGWFRLLNKIYPLKQAYRKKVLEVGCGIGAFSKILKEKKYDVTASDISSFIIDKAKRLQPSIKFDIEDIANKIGRKDEYEIIFAFEVLEHLKNPAKALINLKKRLKKDGVLIFSSPYPTQRTLSDPTHINVHTPEEWVKLGKEIGFKKTKFQYVSFLPFFYRYNSLLSWAFPIKTNLPIIVNTCFFIFEN